MTNRAPFPSFDWTSILDFHPIDRTRSEIGGKTRNFHPSKQGGSQAIRGGRSAMISVFSNVFVVRPGRFELPAPRLGGALSVMEHTYYQ